jgi:tetratricopeptide (TPR) repeat protein
MEPVDESAGKNRRVLTLLFVVLSLLILYFYGAIHPTALTWGFQSYGFLPWYYFLATIILVATAAGFLFIKGETSFPRLLNSIVRHQIIFFIFLGLLFFGLSYLLRVRAPLLGDGFFLVKNFSDAIHGDSPVYYRDEPLATGYFWWALKAFGFPATYQGFLQGYLIAELVLEAGFFLAVYFTLRFLSDDPTARVISMLSITAMPYMQLFFGYVETYSVTLFVLSFYILVVVLTLRGKVPFFLLPSCFLLLFLTHYLTALLFPSLLYIAYREIKNRGWKHVAAGFGIAASIFLIILIAINFDIDPYTTTVPHHHYLSLTSETNSYDADTEAYTLLSQYHLNDLTNYFILMGIPLLLIIPLARRGKLADSFLRREMRWFFIFAVVPMLCAFLFIKLDLGAIRDWDVFAAYFYPIALFLSVQTTEFADAATVRSVLFIIIVLFLFSSAYWLVNAGTEPAVARILTVFDRRVLSHGAYYTASLNLAQYYHQSHQDEKAIDVWARYQNEFPGDPRSYENLIFNYQKLPPPHEADIERVYRKWHRTIPTDTTARQLYRNYCVDRGNTFFQEAHYSNAALYYQQAITIDSTYANALNNLGSVYAQQGNRELAEKYFLLALRRNQQYGEAMFNLGTMLADEGKIDEAKGYYRSAAALHLDRAIRGLDSLEKFSKPGHRK